VPTGRVCAGPSVPHTPVEGPGKRGVTPMWAGTPDICLLLFPSQYVL